MRYCLPKVRDFFLFKKCEDFFYNLKYDKSIDAYRYEY